MKKLQKVVAFSAASLLVVGAASCSKQEVVDDTKTYTEGVTALASNWNPHTWEENADSAVLSFLEMGFVDMSIKDSKEKSYQWVYEMATSIEDVTASHTDDVTKYKCTVPSGNTPNSGYVFEIKLNPNAKWADGKAITADDYVYSMEQLLSPQMRNYRANLYHSGENAVAGALAFYNSGAPIYEPVVPAYGDGETPDYSFDIKTNKVYLDLNTKNMTIAPYSFTEMAKILGGNGASKEQVAQYTKLLEDFKKNVNPYGLVEVDPNDQRVKDLVGLYVIPFGLTYSDELLKETLFFTNKKGESVSFDKVGLYKVDDYTIRYVTQTKQELNYFLTSCTSTWLVHKDLYEANKKQTGALTTTTYGTSEKNYCSYGPYKLESLQVGKQMVLVKNPHWYGYDENLNSMTQFDVDGKKVSQFETDRIVMNVLDPTTQKQMFFKGEISGYTLQANEIKEYNMSDSLYQVDETYSMSLFFNSNLNALTEMDKSKGNQNSKILSNDKFRKGMSLAINRAEWVKTTPAYKPTYSLMSDMYYYDIFNDPNSTYRGTDQAKKAIVDLYGVEYGAGKKYATLDAAYKSITGYNKEEASKLMKEACQELVNENLYKENDPIKIRVGWAKGALTDDDKAQIASLQKYLNEAAAGTGIGKIELVAVDNLPDRYGDVPKGEYAIGFGAWGGAAFYPFRNMDVYFNSDQYAVNETGCWNPATETHTINVNGTDVTKTFKDWSLSLYGKGEYANSSFDNRLDILSNLEKTFLEKYYRIPLATTTAVSLLSKQIEYYTKDYQIMYGFGGFRLLKFKMNDAEWKATVQAAGGNVDYH